VQAADDYATIYAYLRRTYYRAGTDDWDAAELTALATTAYTSATKEVVITGTNSEAGGAAQAEMKFNKMVLLQAIEALLQAECSTSLPPEDPHGTIVNFGHRPVAF
jgi:hypothetical protein